jgi:hypothetical protein
MRIAQCVRTPDGRWHEDGPPDLSPQLALVFAGAEHARTETLLAELHQRARGACVVGASTAGEIHGSNVGDGTVSMTLVEFAHTPVRTCALPAGAGDSRDQGRRLVEDLATDDLRHVFVLFEGNDVNGSELVAGMRDTLRGSIGITGGLAGDGDRFGATIALHGTTPQRVRGVAVGLYGEHIQLRCASLGGWDPFGPERVITRSRANVLHELDGRPALELYKAYLGDYAQRLPASGLLFPLCIRTGRQERGLVRTILACDERDGSMTFAGDVPEGAFAQLMRANLDRLIEGAEDAAEATVGGKPWTPDLAILISCVGRKLVLQQHVEEEVLAVQRVYGQRTRCAGFYSYGEISPFTPDARCELHNQTMTITAIAEV